MAWETLPTNYTDAVWDGMKKYREVNNSDGTVSFDDVTIYMSKENSFFGAKDANSMNKAINNIMTANLTKATSTLNTDLLLFYDNKAKELKAITYDNLMLPIIRKFSFVNATGAGAHNSIYRGQYLGTIVTDEHHRAISNGDFTDLYIGDYWTINGVNWRIAAFDYYYGCGESKPFNTHHAVIVPDTCLETGVMSDDSNGTVKSYNSSKMLSGFDRFQTKVHEAFSTHLCTHEIFITTKISNGCASEGKWVEVQSELMTENMVYGCNIFSPVSNGTVVPCNYRVEKGQLPLFAFEPSRIRNGSVWWLRDIVNDTSYAMVGGHGEADFFNAHTVFGFRPAFCIS